VTDGDLDPLLRVNPATPDRTPGATATRDATVDWLLWGGCRHPESKWCVTATIVEIYIGPAKAVIIRPADTSLSSS